MTMEAAKFQDLQGELTSRRPTDSQWCSFCSKAGRPETQEESVLQFEPTGREKIMSPLVDHQARGVPSYLRKNQPFCSIQALDGLDEAHLH